MKKINSYEDFSRLSPRGQRRWLESQIKNSPGHSGSVLADVRLDLFILFHRDSSGQLTIARTERLSNIRERHELKILAKGALVHQN